MRGFGRGSSSAVDNLELWTAAASSAAINSEVSDICLSTMLTFGLYFSINTRTDHDEEKEACIKMKLGDTYKTGREGENVVFSSCRTETTAREREQVTSYLKHNYLYH